MALFAGCSGCAREVTDKNIRTILASNTEWTVTGIGDLRAPRSIFALNNVQFEAHRRGEVFAREFLYQAAANDRGFLEQYPAAEWQQQNAVRFWYDVPRRTHPPVRIVVENKADLPLRWLLISGADLLLLLDLRVDGKAELLTDTGADITYVSAAGELADNTKISVTTNTFAESVRQINVTVRASHLTISPSR